MERFFRELWELIRAILERLRDLLDRLAEEREEEEPETENGRHPAADEVPTNRLDLRDDESIVSPPIVASPLYACSEVVVLLGFIPHAQLEIQVDGTTVVSTTGAFPEPGGQAFTLPSPLVAHQVVRARQQRGSATSGWSSPVTVSSHTQDYPAGPPRPQINPAPVHECGARTGVSNLLIGSKVWITADGTEFGRVEGSKEHQGINVDPSYGLGQNVRARASLCDDPSPPSVNHVSQAPPSPLPTPVIEDVFAGAEQIRIVGLANGARFVLARGGSDLGTWRTWGQAHLVTLNPALAAGEALAVRQWLCAGEPESPEGTTTVQPCSALPPPVVGPIQHGDSVIHVITAAPGAVIKVFANLVKVGESSGPIIPLISPVSFGDTIHVIQVLGTCMSATAREVGVRCVSPPIGGDPSALDLFPVGHSTYDGGTFSFDGTTYTVKGTVYYPAEDDGADQPFHARLAEQGPVPILFMAHGNHATHRSTADPLVEFCGGGPGRVEIPNHEGYDYFQRALARMGVIAVSLYSNETNCKAYGTANMRHRAELIIQSLRHFQTLSAAAGGLFGGKVDFGRVGLLGHSRGGEAAVVVPEVLTLAGVTIRGVISLAPTDAGTSSGRPRGYALLVVLPAGDGDVRTNAGARFYDGATPSPFRCQFYMENTNHNYFNRQWPQDEGKGPPRLSRSSHERLLLVYGCAFFRSVLLGHPTLRFLSGQWIPAGVPTKKIQISFQWHDQLTVDDHEQPNGIGENTLNQPTEQLAGLAASEDSSIQQGSACSAGQVTYYGNATRMVAMAERAGGEFRSRLDVPRDLSAREIWLRSAEVHDPPTVPPGATGFQVGVEDANGVVAWVDADAVGGLPRPYDRGDCYVKTMPLTRRFAATCFIVREPRLDPSAIVAIRLKLDRPDQRVILFDDLQIVDPALP